MLKRILLYILKNMKKYILILLAVLIFCSTQQVQAQANPRYQIHETATTKKYVIRGGVTWMGMFSEGFAIVGKEGGYSRPKSFFVIDKTGNKVFDLPDGYKPSLQGEYESYYKVRFDSGRLVMEKEENYKKTISIINTRGEVVKTFNGATRASQFRDGIAVIELSFNQPPMIVDINGNIIKKTFNICTTGNYYWLYPLTEGMRYYCDSKTRKYGFLDNKCNLVIPPKFKNAEPFSEGLAAVQNDEGIWGFIDKSGRYAIEPMFTNKPGDFHCGLAHVIDKSFQSHYINKTGKVVWTAGNEWTRVSFTDKGNLIGYDYILNQSFAKVAKFNPVVSNKIWQYNDDWFVLGNDLFDEKQILDYNGNYLLRCFTDRMICDGIGRHQGNNDWYYFNLKGEIIVRFEDTKF